MNLILLFESDFVDASRARVRIEGRRARHVRKVLRAGVGDTLTVGLANGPVGSGRVSGIERTSVELEVELGTDPPPPLDVVVVLALPRPPVLRRSLAAIASLGVKQVELVDAERVEGSFWDSRSLRDEAVEEQLVLGLEQARDTRLPSVRAHRRFRAFVNDVLPVVAEGRSGYLADPAGAPAPPSPWSKPAVAAIGPEGGWVPSEVEALTGAGLRPFALGDRAVRVETAVGLVLGRYL